MCEAGVVEMANNLVTREIPTRFQSKDFSSNGLTVGRSAQEVSKMISYAYEALVNSNYGRISEVPESSGSSGIDYPNLEGHRREQLNGTEFQIIPHW